MVARPALLLRCGVAVLVPIACAGRPPDEGTRAGQASPAGASAGAEPPETDPSGHVAATTRAGAPAGDRAPGAGPSGQVAATARAGAPAGDRAPGAGPSGQVAATARAGAPAGDQAPGAGPSGQVASGARARSEAQETGPSGQLTAAAQPRAEEPLPSPRPMPAEFLGFARACEARERVVLAGVGDLLMHHELQIQATVSPLRFRVLWQAVEDLLGGANVTYANLETPLAAGVLRSGEEVSDPGLVFDRKVYTAYPRFNVHPSLAEDLVTSGVDVVSTANNHALDRGPLGVDKTLAALDAAGLKHTGTRARGATGPWHAVTEAKGLRVAWLACTMSTNMIEDPSGQVLRCFDEPSEVETKVRALAQRPEIDAVIVTPHWGNEYAPEPNKKQKQYARRWAEAGAAAIIGNHPHVLQPWEKIATQDGREVLVAYSLGNFVSHQPELPKRSTVILYIGLGRAEPTGKAFVYGAGYVPVHVRQTGDEFFAEAIDRVGGPADSRAHIVEIFGAANLLGVDKSDAAARARALAPQCWPG